MWLFFVCVVVKALHDFKTSTIPVYIILNGNSGSNWLRSMGTDLLPFSFLFFGISSSNIASCFLNVAPVYNVSWKKKLLALAVLFV